MADLITELTDDDIKTEWRTLDPSNVEAADDDATDVGDGTDSDDDGSDSDDDASDGDADQTDS